MKYNFKTIIFICLVFSLKPIYSQAYKPDWESIDSREIPQWFTNAKFGIFIHWGVYSVPSYRPVSKKMYDTYAEWYQAKVMHDNSIGEQFHKKNYGKHFEYRSFGPQFKAELFEPDQWAELFQKSGARYVVLTSKHHDGYCLWPSKSKYKKNWNSMDVGPNRDILGDLTIAVRKQGLKMGIYYSLMEWETTPRNHEWSGGLDGYYLPDSIINKYKINDPEFINDLIQPQLKELVNQYQPSLIFTDGEWDKSDDYWQSKEFLSWLYNEAPNKHEVVVNDRWGQNTRGKHGGYYTSEYSSDQEHMSHEHAWEESRGMGQSYGYNRAENIQDYSSSSQLIYQLVEIVSRGGNLLLNIGPTSDGRIPVIMQQRLMDIGNWLNVNGEAIYETKTYVINHQKVENTEYFFTTKNNDLYVLIFNLRNSKIDLELPSIKSPSEISVLGIGIIDRPVLKSNRIQIDLNCINLLKLSNEKPIVVKLTNAL